MKLWQAIILGLVEGITEYLPVSSTGHLIIAAALMGLDDPARKSSIDAFTIVIQGGAILAVMGLYWPRIVQMLRGIAGRDVEGRRLLLNIALAFLPAAVIGVMIESWIEARLFRATPVIAALLLGGVYMMIVDRAVRPPRTSAKEGPARTRRLRLTADGEISDLTPRGAFTVGCFQVIAMWPGMSRSMMTITGGIFAGLRPGAAAEFSFLVGLPTLGGATVYKLAKNLHQSRQNGTPNMFDDLGVMASAAGLVVATISAAVAVRWLVSFLNRHGLTPFGIYRIGVGLVMLILLQAGILTIGARPLIEEREQPVPAPVGLVDDAPDAA